MTEIQRQDTYFQGCSEADRQRKMFIQTCKHSNWEDTYRDFFPLQSGTQVRDLPLLSIERSLKTRNHVPLKIVKLKTYQCHGFYEKVHQLKMNNPSPVVSKSPVPYLFRNFFSRLLPLFVQSKSEGFGFVWFSFQSCHQLGISNTLQIQILFQIGQLGMNDGRNAER